MKVERGNLKHGGYAERTRGKASVQRDGEWKTSGLRQVLGSKAFTIQLRKSYAGRKTCKRIDAKAQKVEV